uniref:Leucine-rich repeat-containing N-terminal plant-type domain-containing protein n=1 Tax=Fagus sylvatica TaxID=28930 RepID=A0A2N9HQ86_FAGSY
MSTEHNGTHMYQVKEKLLSSKVEIMGAAIYVKLQDLGVKALNSIFQKWDAKAAALWNITGDPCSGSAIDDGIDFEDPMNNPAIKCDCTLRKWRVFALNKTGVIPKELVALKFLTFLKIDQNYFTGPLPAFIGNLSALELLSIAANAFSGTIPKELGNLKELRILWWVVIDLASFLSHWVITATISWYAIWGLPMKLWRFGIPSQRRLSVD